MNVEAVRSRFSALQNGFAFFDAPGGSQVPDEVGQAVARTLAEASGNLGAPYETGRRVEAILYGALAPTTQDRDLLAVALNERYSELGGNHPIAFSDDDREAEPGC